MTISVICHLYLPTNPIHMSNSTIKVFILACAVSPMALLSQPTLTAAGTNPVVGDQFTTHTTQYVAPGSSGASQTWNLAMTSSGSSSSTGVTPSSTPYAANFPTASVCFGTGPYTYYKTSSSAWQMNGMVNGSGTVLAYSDLEDMMRFPFTFGNSYTDTWSTTFVQATYTYYRVGTTTVTADGWGTLTTPAGTFSNVLRVHFVQTYQDSTNIMSTPYVIDYVNDEYMWYLNGNHNPIAAVYDLTATPGGNFTGGFYIQNVVSGIDNYAGVTSLSLFPSVATEQINFSYTLNGTSEVTISIMDANGRSVMEIPQVQVYEGENTYTIDVAELPAGNYYASISYDNALPVVRKFMVVH